MALAGPIADFVVALGNDGRITSQGSVADALAQNQTLAKEVKHEEQAVELDENEDEDKDAEEDAATGDSTGKLVVAEEIELGHVSRSACTSHHAAITTSSDMVSDILFLSALGGKFPTLFWAQYVGAGVAAEVFDALEVWWLGYWATQYTLHPQNEVSVP